MKMILSFFLLIGFIHASDSNVKMKDIKKLANEGDNKILIVDKSELKKYVTVETSSPEKTSSSSSKKVSSKSTTKVQQTVSSKNKVTFKKEVSLIKLLENAVSNYLKTDKSELKKEILKLSNKYKELDTRFIKKMKMSKANIQELLAALKGM